MATGGGDASTDDLVVAALEKDIRRFANDEKVPEGLSHHVSASEETQALWYKQLVTEWSSNSKPITALDALRLVWDALEKVHPDGLDTLYLQGFLEFYNLPHYCHLVKVDTSVLTSLRSPPRAAPQFEEEDDPESPLKTPELNTLELMSCGKGVKDAPVFLLRTLTVIRDDVTDGGAFTAYVEVKPYHIVPLKILSMITQRRTASLKGDEDHANELLVEINKMEDYEIMDVDRVETLTRRYQIRLRGIDAPGIETPLGIVARNELEKTVDGKCFTIGVYYLDQEKRCIGDVYYKDTLLQDLLGSAWHCLVSDVWAKEVIR